MRNRPTPGLRNTGLTELLDPLLGERGGDQGRPDRLFTGGAQGAGGGRLFT